MRNSTCLGGFLGVAFLKCDSHREPNPHHTFFQFRGNLQTIYCSFGDFSKVDPVVYERWVFQNL